MDTLNYCQSSQQLEEHFEKPQDFLIWACRVYLGHYCRGEPVPEKLPQTFANARLGGLYCPLMRVLNNLTVSSLSDLTIHQVNCPTVAQHEQALVVALRCLQQNNQRGYYATMASILSPTTIRVIYRDMVLVASALMNVEENWLPNVTASSAGPMVAEVETRVLH